MNAVLYHGEEVLRPGSLSPVRRKYPSLSSFFLANGPEKKDADFSWREYVHSHNGELLGAYGNFVNRSLAFIAKYFDGIIPAGIDNSYVNNHINELFISVGKQIENGTFKDAIAEILAPRRGEIP